MLEATTLLNIETVTTARNPSAEEAAYQAEKLLTALSVDPAFSAYERATAIQMLGVHGYNIYDYAGADRIFKPQYPRSRRLETVAHDARRCKTSQRSRSKRATTRRQHSSSTC
jgi:hypothetical protein